MGIETQYDWLVVLIGSYIFLNFLRMVETIAFLR